MRQRDREKHHARRPPQLQPRLRILVVCEGSVTEPEYFFAFRDWVRNPRVQITLPKTRGTPFTLVQLALRLKQEAARRARAESDENLHFDEVWCVYDVDDHPKLNDARQLAEANHIQLAISNPCFELWLLLHFRESPGARHRDELPGLLSSFLKDYDKHLDAGKLLPGYALAKERAERLDHRAQAIGEEGHNPSTGVYRLTERIRGGG